MANLGRLARGWPTRSRRGRCPRCRRQARPCAKGTAVDARAPRGGGAHFRGTPRRRRSPAARPPPPRRDRRRRGAGDTPAAHAIMAETENKKSVAVAARRDRSLRRDLGESVDGSPGRRRVPLWVVRARRGRRRRRLRRVPRGCCRSRLAASVAQPAHHHDGGARARGGGRDSGVARRATAGSALLVHPVRPGEAPPRQRTASVHPSRSAAAAAVAAAAAGAARRRACRRGGRSRRAAARGARAGARVGAPRRFQSASRAASPNPGVDPSPPHFGAAPRGRGRIRPPPWRPMARVPPNVPFPPPTPVPLLCTAATRAGRQRRRGSLTAATCGDPSNPPPPFRLTPSSARRDALHPTKNGCRQSGGHRQCLS